MSRSQTAVPIKHYQNTLSFEHTLKRALEMQDAMIPCKTADVPKLSKTSRSFKEVAEILLDQLEFIKLQGSLSPQKTANEEVDITTTGTHMEEEFDHLNDQLKEKEKTIEMLSKEKNYYQRKAEQFSLQVSSLQECSKEQKSADDLQLKLSQSMASIKSQKELILRQQDFIEELEDKIRQQDLKLEAPQGDEIGEQQFTNCKGFHSANSSLIAKGKDTKPDSSRQAAMQAKIIEDLAQQNASLQSNLAKLQEDQLCFGTGEWGVPASLSQLVSQIHSSVAPNSFCEGALENQLVEIKQFVDKCQCKEAGQTVKPNLKSLCTTPTFSKYVNLNNVEQIYSEFFSQLSSTHQQVETKNRCFKDLYNVIEDSVAKFHNLFIAYNTGVKKVQKFEETFKQLDSVFSTDYQGDDDGQVLEDLRRLSGTYLQQIFDLQKELTEVKSLEDMPSGLVKLLEKSHQKLLGKDQTGPQPMSLEEQVWELSDRLRDQEKGQRQKEKRMSKQRQSCRGSQSVFNSTLQRPVKSQERLPMNSVTQYQHQEVLGSLNKALDKIQELEAANNNLEKEKTVLDLEHTTLREEQQKNKAAEKARAKNANDREHAISQLQRENQELQSSVQEQAQAIEKLEGELKDQTEKAQKIVKLNEELRDLIEQERNAYNEERQKDEEDIEQLTKANETKIKLIKNKLMMLLSPPDASTYSEKSTSYSMHSIDDIIRKLSDQIFALKSKQPAHTHGYSLGYANPQQCVPQTRIQDSVCQGLLAQERREPSPLKPLNSNTFGNTCGIKKHFNEVENSVLISGYFRGEHSKIEHEDSSRPQSPSRMSYFTSQEQDRQGQINAERCGTAQEKRIDFQSILCKKDIDQQYHTLDYASQIQTDTDSSIEKQKRTLQSQDSDPQIKNSGINNILVHFRKEKEQFNEKLSQLRNKLQSVQSPELPHRVSRLEHEEIAQKDCFPYPCVDSRRTQTLHKIKTSMGSNSLSRDEVSARQFPQLKNCK